MWGHLVLELGRKGALSPFSDFPVPLALAMMLRPMRQPGEAVGCL